MGLHRLSVGNRLVAGFLIVVLGMVAVTALGVIRVGQVSDRLTVINELNSVKQRYAINFRGSVHDRAISLRPGSGWELRREATASADDPARPGWTVVDVGFTDPERFADRVTGYGADAVVLSPDEARDAVVRRLRGLAS